MNVRKVITTVAAIGAGLAANKLLTIGWKATTGHAPPSGDADDDEASLGELVIFAAVSGAVIAFARILASRGASKWLDGGNPEITKS